MEICKAPTLALKALNKHSHIMYIEMENVIPKNKYVYDLVPKGVHENRTKGVENKVDDTLKLVMFLECAQC